MDNNLGNVGEKGINPGEREANLIERKNLMNVTAEFDIHHFIFALIFVNI